MTFEVHSGSLVEFPQDILKEVVEEGNLNTGVELLLATVEGMARDAGVNNSAANQLVQVRFPLKNISPFL